MGGGGGGVYLKRREGGIQGGELDLEEL